MAQGKTIDIANDFPTTIYPSRMIITMLGVLDCKAVAEDMIIEILKIVAMQVGGGGCELGRGRPSTTVCLRRECHFSGVPVALRPSSRSLEMVES